MALGTSFLGWIVVGGSGGGAGARGLTVRETAGGDTAGGDTAGGDTAEALLLDGVEKDEDVVRFDRL